MNDTVKAAPTPTYRRMAEWVGLGGPKPTSAELSACMIADLENREDVDAIEAATIREGAKALNERDADMALIASMEWILNEMLVEARNTGRIKVETFRHAKEIYAKAKAKRGEQ